MTVYSEGSSDDESMIISYCNYLTKEKTHDENSILINTGSTVSVFRNPKMLTDVRETGTTMRALTNGGYQDSSKQGILPSFFPLWLNEKSRINILVIKDIRKKFRVTADTSKAKEIVVHLSDTKKMVFKEAGTGLYVYNL